MNFYSKHSKPFLAILSLALLFSSNAFAQSKRQNSPSPIVRNEISGTIKARDLGDSRLTTYYYAFKGNRGDIFVNVVTKNFSGDIDIFLVEGLKPKTKITIYADSGQTETGRVIYLRKPEDLLMRIQGRTPDDDAATYQIKFAGSFEPLPGVSGNDDDLPEVENTEEGAVKVNSVGTIIEDPVSETRENDAKDSDIETDEKTERPLVDIPSTFDPTKKPATRIREAIGDVRPRVAIKDPTRETEAKTEDSESETSKNVTVEITEKSPERSALVTIERDTSEDEAKETTEKANPERKPTTRELRRIKLVLILKNGEKIERRMNKVSSVNVFDGVLKIVGTDGKVEKFSILDIAKMTIE